MKGSQTPRIKIEPARVSTDGTGAALLMREYGFTLDEWQQLIIDAWMGKDANGKYTVISGGLSVPRQNGKNCCLEAREFYGLLINGERILHTAHQVRTAKKAFRRLESMFTDKRHPEITRAVKKIRYGIGEESIELENGGLIEFTSRSRQAARGYDGISVVVYDEAQELSEDQAEAIMSVLSASITGTRQILYTGTPPYIGCSGTVFRRFREACIKAAGEGNAANNSWHEWSVYAETVQEIKIDDVKTWYETNPALGYRLTEEFTREEYNTLSADGFSRERLGWWAKPTEESTAYAIDAATWEACKSEENRPDSGKTAYGIKFSVDGSFVVLAAARAPQNGKTRISIINIQPTGAGLVWLAEWLIDRYMKASVVVIDGKNGADVLIDKIKGTWRFKDSIIKPTAQNVVTAAGMLVNAVNERALTWYAGQEALNDSAINATKRPIAGGWGFGGQGAELIEACSLALWGCRTAKRDPTKRMRIG